MSPNRSRRNALVLSFATVLAACGGTDDTAAPPPPAPAAIAPAITIDPASATVGEGAAAQFAVNASGTGPLTYQWAQDGSGPIGGATASTLARPAAQLQDNGKRFGVTVGNTAGSATSALATLSVTERAWSVLDLPPSGAAGAQAAATLFAPAVVIDSQGHTHAVFNQQEANGYTMWAAFKPAGATNFTTFTRLTAAPASSSVFTFSPALAADADGRVIAVWRSSRPDETAQVRAAVYLPTTTAEGAWGAEQDASDPALLHVSELAVAPAGSGAFEVIYVAQPTQAAPRDVVARRATVSGATLAWSDAVVLDDNTEATVGIQVAGNAAGQVVVAWNNGGAFTETRGAARSGSDAWSAPFDIGGVASENVHPASMAIDGQGRGVVAMTGDQTHVLVRRFAFGSTGFALTGVTQYVSDFTHSHRLPVVVAGIDGSFELLSVHNLGRQLSRVRFDGSSWGSQEAVVTIDSAEEVDVIGALGAGIDGAGNLIVTWAQDTDVNSYPVQRARRYHAGLMQWRDMTELFNSDRVLGHDTALAVRPDGSAVALMARGDNVVGLAVFK